VALALEEGPPRFAQGLMYIDEVGTIRLNPSYQALESEWHFCLRHLTWHLALDLVAPPSDTPDPPQWMLAAEVIINRLSSGLFFPVPKDFPNQPRSPFTRTPPPHVHKPEEQLQEWERQRKRNVQPPQFPHWRTPAGPQTWDVYIQDVDLRQRCRSVYLLTQVRGLESKVRPKARRKDPLIQRAYDWVRDEFPLLSAIVADFRLDYDSAERYHVAIGAVSARDRVIYVNPDAPLTELEWRWVVVHEVLHVVLEHHNRLKKRDPLLWNVACDYVINNWLEHMGVGVRPHGVLFKESYKGRSAESIYEELLQNGGNDQLKIRYTLRGDGGGDIMDFDEQYNGPSQPQRHYPLQRPNHRNQLRENVRNIIEGDSEDEAEQLSMGRGDLPADLVEELQLGHLLKQTPPPVPEWKVELASWMDVQLAPHAVTRSYSRLSRRQAAAPHIPMAGRAAVGLQSPTFGVILDTSGSMSNELLQQGLASLVAFAEKNGVYEVRFIMCDAQAYDEGFIAIERLKRPYQIKGRGGTVLQPAVNLLESDNTFPPQAPILIITDGMIDHLSIEREHAYLLPGHGKLPFEPRGPVFNILGQAPFSFGRWGVGHEEEDDDDDDPHP
jgi:predicted metal-dependent peptidase